MLVDEEEEDKIVSRGKVFISQEFLPTLIQFPTNSAQVPIEARIKPVANQLEYTVKIQDTSLKLESKPLPQKRYFIAVMHNSALVLTPCEVTQLRPSMKHIDLQLELDREEIKKQNFEELKDQINYDDAKSVKVTVRSADDVQGNLNAAIEELKRTQDLEVYEKLQITDKSNVYLDLLKGMDDQVVYSFDKREYCENLVKGGIGNIKSEMTSQQTTSGQSSASNISGQSFTLDGKPSGGFYESLHLELEDRLLNLFYSCNCISFSKVLELFDDEAELLNILKNIAVLVNGIWVLKSQFLYEKRQLYSRNYMLGLLQKKTKFKRGEFCEVTHMIGELAINMIKEICCFNKEDQTWSLKDIEQDPSIFTDCKNLILEQQKVVLDLYQGALENFENKAMVKTEKPKPLVKPKIETEEKPQLAWYAIRGESKELQLENMLQFLLKKSAMHEQDILATINYQKLQQSKNNKLIEVTDHDVIVLIGKLCVKIETLCILKTCGDKSLDLFRLSLVDMMKEQGGRVKKQEVFKMWQEVLEQQPSAGVYTKVMQEVAKSKAGGHWTLK